MTEKCGCTASTIRFKERRNWIRRWSLFCGIRVIIPTKTQSRILLILHANHPGLSRMKAIARSYFWWFGLDNDIERQAKSYLASQAIKPTPQVALYILGYGLKLHGEDFTYILPDYLWGK